MLKFYISFLFVLASLVVFPQEQSTENNLLKNYPQRYGLRLGADVVKATRNFWDKDYKGFEITADYRWDKKLFIAAELGKDVRYKKEHQLSYTTNGQYLKLGADYNLHNNWLDLENRIYIGGRYGVSLHGQELHSYKINSSDAYFEEIEARVNKVSSGLMAHWLEVVGGMQTRVFNNVFMGFSVRFAYLVYQTQPEGFENLYIPGYGQKYSGSIGASFNYSLSYFIPLYKKKGKPFKESSFKK